MSKKISQELMQLDLYELWGLSSQASEKEIKKCYRKKALSCHPDRNPDNPDAAEEFIRLKKILEILLDPGARSAYDRVLKARKAAAIRARDANAKSRKLKDALEKREEAARSEPRISEEERLKRELKRLEEEGESLIAEELERVNKQVEEELRRTDIGIPQSKTSNIHRIKAHWTSTDDWPGYTKEELHNLFYKWGEINAVVVKQKGIKGTALIEYKDESGQKMSLQFEKGMVGKPIEVTVASSHKEKKKEKAQKQLDKKLVSSRDFESVSSMNQRRAIERQKLIEEIMKNDG